MTLNQLATVENIDIPRFRSLLDATLKVVPGRDDATAYEDAVERLLSALFYPSLCFPYKQHPIHEGRKRIDITYVNNPQVGFFMWVANHYPSAHVFVECKNYGRRSEIRSSISSPAVSRRTEVGSAS